MMPTQSCHKQHLQTVDNAPLPARAGCERRQANGKPRPPIRWRKLGNIVLENLMEKAPDPNEVYTATGWHCELMALLGRFGYRPVGRIDAWNLAWKLLELGYDQQT